MVKYGDIQQEPVQLRKHPKQCKHGHTQTRAHMVVCKHHQYVGALHGYVYMNVYLVLYTYEKYIMKYSMHINAHIHIHTNEYTCTSYYIIAHTCIYI